MTNPQGFQMLQNVMRNNGDPMSMLKGMLGNKSPEQLEGFFNTAKQMGVADKYIQQVKDGINQEVDINIKKGE